MITLTDEELEYICDRICRWPHESQDEEEMEGHCKECPIGREEG